MAGKGRGESQAVQGRTMMMMTMMIDDRLMQVHPRSRDQKLIALATQLKDLAAGE
jgi:hypothetical protein